MVTGLLDSSTWEIGSVGYIWTHGHEHAESTETQKQMCGENGRGRRQEEQRFGGDEENKSSRVREEGRRAQSVGEMTGRERVMQQFLTTYTKLCKASGSA